MSFNELLAELPALSTAERQLLIRRALEIDESGLSAADEALIEQRRADHRRDPASSISLEEMNSRLRSRSGQ